MKEFLSYIGRLKVKCGWHSVLGRHSHQHNEILLILGGFLNVHVNEESFQARKGDAIFYAPGIKHFESADSKEGADFIFFSVPASRKINSKFIVKDTSRKLLTLAHWIAEERERPFEKRKKLLQLYIDVVILELERFSKEKPNSPLSHIRNYMADNLTAKHDISSLAKKAGISKFHFIRKYQKYFGISPIQDLLRMRLEAACNLLITTEMTLKQIAEKTGFCDQYHFSRIFKKYLEITPGYFRNKRI